MSKTPSDAREGVNIDHLLDKRDFIPKLDFFENKARSDANQELSLSDEEMFEKYRMTGILINWRWV